MKPLDQVTNHKVDKTCKHTKIWIISGGYMLWCYQCGAIRPNIAGSRKNPIKWQPISKDGENPAMEDWHPALTWKNQL
jgi:hypothetical protein